MCNLWVIYFLKLTSLVLKLDNKDLQFKEVKLGLYENDCGSEKDIENIKDLDFEQSLTLLPILPHQIRTCKKWIIMHKIDYVEVERKH